MPRLQGTSTHSSVGFGLRPSSGDDGRGELVSIFISIVDTTGVGESISALKLENGALCGRGDISIESFPGPGDDDGRGGVVVCSATVSIGLEVHEHHIPRPLIAPRRLEVKRDRLGVGSWGLVVVSMYNRWLL